MKIHRFFTTVIYIYIYVQSVKNMSFPGFYPFSNWERESGKQNLGVTEKCPKVTYLIFLTGFHWRIFLLSRANRLRSVFSTGLKDFGVLHVSVSLLSLARSKMAIVRLPRDLLKNYFLCIYFRWGEGNPTSVWGPRQSFGFIFSFPFRCPATQGHLGANICVTHILS